MKPKKRKRRGKKRKEKEEKSIWGGGRDAAVCCYHCRRCPSHCPTPAPCRRRSVFPSPRAIARGGVCSCLSSRRRRCACFLSHPGPRCSHFHPTSSCSRRQSGVMCGRHPPCRLLAVVVVTRWGCWVAPVCIDVPAPSRRSRCHAVVVVVVVILPACPPRKGGGGRCGGGCGTSSSCPCLH